MNRPYLEAYLSGELPKPTICPSGRTRYCGDNDLLLAWDNIRFLNGESFQFVNERRGD